MSETGTQKALAKEFSNFDLNRLFQEAVKNMSDKAPFSIEPFEFEADKKSYMITPTRVDHEEVIKKANSSCKDCYGKGYFVSNILKTKLPDPSIYLEIKPEHSMPETLSEEQQKIWMEREEKLYNESKTWRIMNICPCAIKRYVKNKPNIMYNDTQTLFIDFDYDLITVNKKEDVVEEKTS